MVKKADVPKVALATALDLAAQRGWRDLTMDDIAAEGGLTLVQLHDAYGSKGAILDAFADQTDAAVLAGDSADMAGDAERDRVFDVVMRRFDALGPHKDAVRAIMRDTASDPCAMLGGACRLQRSMRWMLEAARVDTSGLAGRLRVKGLMAIYADVMRVWLRDDSEDLAKTMAALDKRLRQADRLLGAVCRMAPRGATATTETAEQPA
jgi:AcrR family transcriptional regulator